MNRNKNNIPIEIPPHLSREEADIYISVLKGLEDWNYYIASDRKLPYPEFDPNKPPHYNTLLDMKYKLEGKPNLLAQVKDKTAEELPLTEEDWDNVFLKIKNLRKPSN